MANDTLILKQLKNLRSIGKIFTGSTTYENFGALFNLGAALDSEVIYDNKHGLNSIAFNLIIPTGGQVAFECSYDGKNFVPCTLRSIEFNDYTQKSSQSSHFKGSIANARLFRVRVISVGSAPGAVVGRAILDVSTIEGIEHGWRPDNFGNDQTHKDVSFTTAQTNTVIWTPAAGKKVVVTGMIVSTDGVNVVKIFEDTDITGQRLFRNRFPNNAPPFSHSFLTPYTSSTVGNSIKVTSTAAVNLDIVLHGYEID